MINDDSRLKKAQETLRKQLQWAARELENEEVYLSRHRWRPVATTGTDILPFRIFPAVFPTSDLPEKDVL